MCKFMDERTDVLREKNISNENTSTKECIMQQFLHNKASSKYIADDLMH